MPSQKPHIGLTQDNDGHWILAVFMIGGDPCQEFGHATVDIDGRATRHMLQAGLNRLLTRCPAATLSFEVADEMRRHDLILDPDTHRVTSARRKVLLLTSPRPSF